MSAFKKLKRQDVFVTAYTSNKKWSINANDSTDGDIQLYELKKPNLSSLYSGTVDYTAEVLYKSIEHLYYSNFSGSVISGSYENYIQSSLESGSRSLDFDNYLLSITRKKIGQYIEPGTFKIQAPFSNYFGSYTIQVVDNGEGKLIYTNPDNVNFTEGIVGDIIYTHGNVIFYGNTDLTDALLTGSLYTASWESNYPILTQNVICKVSDFEFNFTQNPSAVVSGSNGKLSNNITGSEFRPYITGIGLYNDANELIAVGKFGQPVPKPSYVETTFILKLDL
jgi:hypothetical protein